MILVIIAVSSVLFFMSFVLIKSGMRRFITASGLLVILMLSVVGLIANDQHNFGMKKVTTSKSVAIKPMVASKQLPVKIVLYQPVGTSGKDNVYLYKTIDNKKVNTQTDGKTTNKVKLTNVKQANLTVKTTKYVYTNKVTKWLFKLDNKKQIVKRENKFNLPKNNWVELSVQQAKQLQKTAAKSQTKASQAAQKTAATAYVTGKVKAAIAQKPSLMTDAKAQKALSNKFLAEYKLIVAQKLIKQIKN